MDFSKSSEEISGGKNVEATILTNKRGGTKGVIRVLPVKWRSSNTNKSATRANFGSNFETCESLRVELLHASIRMPKLALIAKLSVWKDCSVL